jgi:cyclophilin family peptidyl-prolyl cis-trans isomerase/HEAT repeat protein
VIHRGRRLLFVLALAFPTVAGAASSPLHDIAIAEDRRLAQDVAPFLANPDAAIRQRAALAVGRIQDTTRVALLYPLLGDPVATVREEAIFALGQVGHRSARESLEVRLAAKENNERQLAIEALGKIADKASGPKIAAQLASPVAALRAEAAIALWRIADSTAVNALIARRADPDPEVRWRVIYALEKIVAPDKVVLPVAITLDDPNWLVRAYAVRTLGRQKSSRATPYILQLFGDADPAVAVNAIRAIQFSGDSTSSAVLNALVRPMTHADPYVRVTAATALADRFAWVKADTSATRRARAALRTGLADRDAATRGACGRALLMQEGMAAFTEVRPMLDDSSLYARIAVLQTLTRLPAAEVAPLLRERLSLKFHLFERMTAAEGLGTLHSKEDLPALRAALTDTSALFASAAASGLAEAGDSSSVRDLARAYSARVKDADADARIAIRDALRQLAGRAYSDSVERVNPVPAPAATDYPADFEKPPVEKGVILHTSKGDIEWAFQSAEAPQTVRNFLKLAARRYFDGTAFHRVVPNFVIQDGDPTGTGSGGPGYTIRCEYNRLRYSPGMVGMALSGKDTGGSQWFINHSPQHHLDGRYTIFAKVTRGMEVTTKIVQGDKILSVEILK